MRFEWNMDAFAELRNHPALVSAMEAAANHAVAGTPFEVEVEVWPHQGVRAGPRTTVQIWARSWEARQVVNDRPGELTAVLNRARL